MSLASTWPADRLRREDDDEAVVGEVGEGVDDGIDEIAVIVAPPDHDGIGDIAIVLVLELVVVRSSIANLRSSSTSES